MPDDSYRHLVIERELRRNDRRTRKINIPHPDRGDLRAHGQRLFGSLDRTIQLARQQVAAAPGSFVLKLNYTGNLDFAHLQKHGIEFVSQEGRQMCVVFGSEQGLAIFADHLQRLGLEDADLTYKQILEALDGIDNWSAEDRKSWAVQHIGFPNTETFKLDVELWPVKVVHHPDRI